MIKRQKLKMRCLLLFTVFMYLITGSTFLGAQALDLIATNPAEPEQLVQLIGNDFGAGQIKYYKFPDPDMSSATPPSNEKTEADITQSPTDSIKSVKTTANSITAPMPGSEFGMYILWAYNNGLSQPKIVNKTEIFGVAPKVINTNAAYPDEYNEVIITGKNLTHKLGTSITDARVYIGSTDVTEYIHQANPYIIRLDLSSVNISSGTYDVWVTNNHGGEWGWTRYASAITVESSLWWGNAIDVQDSPYNCNPNDSLPDHVGLQQAIDDAFSGGHCVHLSGTGTYIIGDGHDLEIRGNDMRIYGDVTIKYESGQQETGLASSIFYLQGKNIILENFKIDGSKSVSKAIAIEPGSENVENCIWRAQAEEACDSSRIIRVSLPDTISWTEPLGGLVWVLLRRGCWEDCFEEGRKGPLKVRCGAVKGS
jgi:hypothetical protein